MTTPLREQAGFRRNVLDRLKPANTVWSVNGRDVVFMADFGLGVEVGGFMAVTTDDGARLIVQVHDLHIAQREAARLDLDAADFGMDGTAVRNANVGLAMRYVEGDGVVLGSVTAAGFHKGSIPAGFANGVPEVANAIEVQSVLDAMLGSSTGLDIGVLGAAAVGASLKASGFARHTFLCGQSGSGKTYSMGVVLERLLLDTDLPLVIVDPNSDYVHLGQLRSRDDINAGRRTPLSRAAYQLLKAGWADRTEVLVASANGGDLPLQIHLSDLQLDEQALLLGLDPIGDGDEFAAYAEATAGLTGAYGFGEVEAVLAKRFDAASRGVSQRIANLGVASWSVWADVDAPSLLQRGLAGRALVLDTGSLADARERSLISLALLGGLRRRKRRSPVSIVIDEAHHVCSPDAATPLERAVVEHAIWVAGEGRKFGIYLVLATQRPQKVHQNVISQCDNVLLMRVNSVTDLDELAHVFSHVPRTMVAEARSFQLGEMLAAGPIAPTPIRLRVGERWTSEGGADLPTTWAEPDR